MEKIEDYKGFEIFAELDEIPCNPREWDNIGTMCFYHRRMRLGDNPETKPDMPKWIFQDFDSLGEFLKENKAIALPVRAYEHGSITITANQMTYSRYPFNDSWDSGWLGIIFATEEQVRKEYGWKRLTRQRRQKIAKYLETEVEIYNCYLTGDVYGYKVLDSEGESIEEVWGYYGYDHEKSGLLQDARAAADFHIEKEAKDRQSHLSFLHAEVCGTL